MSSPSRAPSPVAVLLVSHDGSRWLPTVLAALAGQDGVDQGVLEQVVAVDTGSTDGSVELIEAALPVGGDLHAEVLREDAGTSFPDAVRTGLDRLEATGSTAPWLWILHDDSTPAPDALAALLAAADEHPEADLLGPKLREWPSLRRLLELGVTISRTGQRETGLERGEYDQGQHDEVREVLAVNTAGMLVRREVLEELGGLDPALPVFGNDIDLGWRAAAAGRTTLVVPQAVVFHAEAAHRGLRRTELTGRRTHHQERRAALWTLLVNTSSRRLPLQAARLVLGTVLRAIGLVLVRSPGEALDELTALGSVLARPGDLRASRRRRREARPAGRAADQERVDRLLAPFWLPYRHGLDAVGDLLAAASHQAADVAERRRAAAAAHDPSSMAARRVAIEDDDALADSGVAVRVLTNPIALVLIAVVLTMLVAGRAALGSASGGALSAAPGSAGDWWTLWLESWHPLAQGTPVPAPAYLVPLAVLGSVLTPAGAVSLLMLLAAPLALWGSWRLLQVVGRLASPQGASRWLLLAGSTTYAVTPLASGAWGGGRLGIVLASVLVPWVAHAALAFADPSPDRRWRAAWRTGLLLSLLTAVAPVAWLLALALGLVAALGSLVLAPAAAGHVRTWGPPVVALATVPVLLAPWWVPLVVHGAGAGLLLDVGRVLPAEARTSGVALLVGRVGELGAAGAPWWAGVVPVALALLALVPRSTRVGVLGCWLVGSVVGVVALTLSLVPLSVGGAPAAVGLGVLLVAWQACLVTAAVLGGQGLLAADDTPVGRPGVVGVVVAVGLAAVVAPLVGLAWAVLPGSAGLDEDPVSDVPAYMVQSAMTGPEHGVLVVRGSVEDGLTYEVLRDDGIRLGEDEVIDLSAEDAGLAQVVQTLVSRPRSATVTDLATAGVEYVVLPGPADGGVAAALDATSGLVQASAEDRRTRAWQVDRALDPTAVDGPGSWWRVTLLVLSCLALSTVLVLATPTTREARR